MAKYTKARYVCTRILISVKELADVALTTRTTLSTSSSDSVFICTGTGSFHNHVAILMRGALSSGSQVD